MKIIKNREDNVCLLSRNINRVSYPKKDRDKFTDALIKTWEGYQGTRTGEIVRLHGLGESYEQISESLGISRSDVYNSVNEFVVSAAMEAGRHGVSLYGSKQRKRKRL